jgi:hypothetical protein
MEALSQANPYQVCILLAVWGESFINDFLQLSLPSLLASGNIPALAEAYPTRFTFLSRLRDIPVFEKNPAYQRLKNICQVDFLSIEDLIVQGGYSATLTLAFDRAVKQAGAAMLNTYFVFLTSDYIMADGSMRGLMRYMQKGYSGICAGNFQLMKEEMEPFLLNLIDSETHALSISPRELLKHSFPHLHPVTNASFYSQNMTHNYRANRFFYRLNPDVMAGRFYLLHMLCIKPETMDYRVGSSCDYSFIPEMCPSGNVAVITDSDDYLVVEVQEKHHELSFVSLGRYDTSKLVYALSEWTTVRHRENANHTIYFHTRDVAIDEKRTIEDNFNQFIGRLASGLKRSAPKPYYNHPYWLGAIESLSKQQEILKDGYEYDYKNLFIATTSFCKKIYYKCFGCGPNIYPWHYRYHEYKLTSKYFNRNFAFANKENIAVFYTDYQPTFMKFCDWFKKTCQLPHHFFVKTLLSEKEKIAELEERKFHLCVLMLSLKDVGNTIVYLNLLKKMLKNNGKILVFIPNNEIGLTIFKNEIVNRLNSIMDAQYQIEQIETIHSTFSMAGNEMIEYITQRYAHSRKMRFLHYAIFGIPGCLLSLIRYCIPFRRDNKEGYCTSIFLTLHPERNSEAIS